MPIEKEPDPKRYLYMRCATCGVKLHVEAVTCWKCGNRRNFNAKTGKEVEEVAYGSLNPNDAIYNQALNDAEKCFVCRNTQNSKTCEYCYKFGYGIGRCDLCNAFQNIRFMCCQEIQKLNKKHKAELIEMLDFMAKRKEPGKVYKAVSEQINERIGVAV